MPDELTPEAQAEALLQSEGYAITPPADLSPAKTSSIWKPLPQEFFLQEIQGLATAVGVSCPEQASFTMSDTEQDGVPGHTLTASVK